MTAIRSLMQGRPATLLGTAPDITEEAEAYVAAGGYGTVSEPEQLLENIAAAGLRGRGGAGFPAAVKLAAVRDGAGTPVVVANGAEGEPGSVKDRWLLRARPHLVLDGLARAAAITGAARGYVYLSDPVAGARIRRAITERVPSLLVEVVETEHAYVAGEETAAVRRINGGPALPTAKPPRPFQHGVGDQPTLVSNVETLARIALIAARPDLRRQIAESTLVTLSGTRGNPLLAEVPYSTTLRALAAAQGTPDATGALMGGLFGGLIGHGSLDIPLDPDALADAGTALGCGALRFLAPGECPVALAADAVGHLAAESARQCGVCVAGTASVRDALHGLTAGRADPDAVTKLLRWSTGLPGRGACGLLDAAAGTAGSLLRAFPNTAQAHVDSPCGACSAAPPDGGRRLAVAVPEAGSSLATPAPAMKGTP
ncbi:Fe-S-binding domain-containing protein [Streptomyces lunaelactis]|uniref:NADH-ubiquinone oxidoreductase-F iron-sulfur binding region domain-containing protein n=1 Tax=Streptomyces lunaelactis TaxID=1535768 RepID=UPI0015857D4F|nr:Fe-S-binding domain-containing protein [Streptomyces lunaelactis]